MLRVEDHDRGRCREAYETAIAVDLEWLGLKADNANALVGGQSSAYRQSDNLAVYAAAIHSLANQYKVYACSCTRQEIAARSPRLGGSGEADDQGFRELCYDGFCRERNLPLGAAGTGLRVHLPESSERFTDLWLGPQAQTPATQCGDLLLRDRDGYYTYNFAVVVDDLRHGIDLVIRGQDLLHATGRQLQLARALGRREPPQYLHHPLVVDANGRKLGKRFFATSLASLRAAGKTAAEVLGEAAYAAGLQAQPAPLLVEDFSGLFTGRTWFHQQPEEES